jgi:hypothetical protein
LIVRIATGVFFVIRKEQVVSIIVRPIFINWRSIKTWQPSKEKSKHLSEITGTYS